MNTIKKLTFFSAAALAMATALISCNGNGEKSESSDLISFESYSYKVYAQGEMADSVAKEIPDYTGVWECRSNGVLPKSAAGKDVTALRDTLCSLAGVSFTDEGKVQTKLPDFLTTPDAKLDTVQARSMLVSNVSLNLLTPKVMVFDIYSYQYPEGAAHGTFANTFINYSLTEGKVLTLTDIFGSDYEAKLLPLIKQKLSERDDLLVSLDDVKISPNFQITDEGVNFVYGIYVITPYSSGEPKVSFYAAELKDILTPTATSLFD